MISALFAQAPPLVVPGKEWLILVIVALTPVIVQVLDWFFGNVVDAELPSWLKPTLATALGSLLTVLAGVTSNDPVIVALVGLAVAGIRQVLVHLTRAVVKRS